MKKQFLKFEKGVKVLSALLLSVALAFTGPAFAKIVIGEDQEVADSHPFSSFAVVSEYEKEIFKDTVVWAGMERESPYVVHVRSKTFVNGAPDKEVIIVDGSDPKTLPEVHYLKACQSAGISSAPIHVVYRQINRRGELVNIEEIYHVKFVDGIWSAPQLLMSTDYQRPIRLIPNNISCKGENVGLALQHGPSLFFTGSRNNGETWSEPVRVGNPEARLASRNPLVRFVLGEGANVFMAWTESSENPTSFNVYFQRSTDGGISWKEPNVPIDVDWTYAARLRLVAQQENVYIAWNFLPYMTGVEPIFGRLSTNSGASFLPTEIIASPGDADLFNLRGLHMDNSGRLYVVWDGYLQSPINETRINFRSNIGGKWQEPKVIFTSRGAADTIYHVETSANENGAIGISFTFPGWKMVFATTSKDEGQTWECPPDQPCRLDRIPPGNYGMQAVSASMANEVPHMAVIWAEQRTTGTGERTTLHYNTADLTE